MASSYSGCVRVLLLCLFLLVVCGCTERRLFVRTEPAGADVRVNGKHVGRSPASWRFDHYGTVLVEVELDGHEPQQREVELRSPWWQKPGIDFFADVVLPARLRDEHAVEFVLEPVRTRSEAGVEHEVEELATAARALRARSGESE